MQCSAVQVYLLGAFQKSLSLFVFGDMTDLFFMIGAGVHRLGREDY